MRYGLISNYRRSWSKVGERTIIDNQQEYVNRYLYSAIDPINGNNFHMIGFSDINTFSTNSPELIPVERFFQEIRKVTANMIFENINIQERLIENALVD